MAPTGLKRTQFDGPKLRALRRGRHLTLQQVADAIAARTGGSQTAEAVRSWELKGQMPHGDSLLALADVFGLEPEQFLTKEL